MRKLITVALFAIMLAGVPASAYYEYAGEWNNDITTPGAIAIRRDTNSGPIVYVGDYGDDRVKVFYNYGALYTWFGGTGSGPGQFINPTGLDFAWGPGQQLSIADWGNERIKKCTTQGLYIREWPVWNPGAPDSTNPFDVAVAPTGDVYAVSGLIFHYTGTGSFVDVYGDEDPGWVSAEAIGIAPNGNIYVADWRDPNNIAYFTSTGSFLGRWYSSFYQPWGVTVGNDGRVYVADTGNHCIKIFTGTGSLIQLIGSRGWGPGQFIYPKDVAVTNDGNYMYVVEASRIQYFWDNPMGIDGDGADGSTGIEPSSLGKVKALFR